MKYYVVDSFTEKMFSGNPAGVCLLEGEISEKLMQDIASENNLAETAFVRKNGDSYDLRWFTPEIEIDLCGHATLAAAFVILNFVDKARRGIIFNTRSGEIRVAVKKNIVDLNDVYEMDFPAWELKALEITELMGRAIGGANIKEAYLARDLILVLDSEEAVAGVAPDFELIREIPEAFALVVTARGNKSDFVSRFFAPKAGISEDHVTGSSHSELIPYWAKQLDKKVMTALQLSKRGGCIFCEHHGERVKIAGKAVLYMSGEIIYNKIKKGE